MRDGARVVTVALSKDQLDALMEDLAPQGCDCLRIPADPTNPEDVAAVVEAVRNDVGSLDVLINNEGS